MSCLGVHFALDADEVAALRALQDEGERLDYLQEELEEKYLAPPMELAAESDKAWDAMHRALADGTLDPAGGSFPLNHVVLGGEPLYSGEDYIMSLKTPQQVQAIAAALRELTQEQFRAAYDRIDPAEYGFDVDDDDFEYTWQWFQDVRELYVRAAAQGRHVLFTADQ